jgi:hypothetical protein
LLHPSAHGIAGQQVPIVQQFIDIVVVVPLEAVFPGFLGDGAYCAVSLAIHLAVIFGFWLVAPALILRQRYAFRRSDAMAYRRTYLILTE